MRLEPSLPVVASAYEDISVGLGEDKAFTVDFLVPVGLYFFV